MICRKCGANLAEDARFCECCGTYVPTAEENTDRPLTTAQSVGLLLLFSVPLVNLIAALCWAFGKNVQESRRSLARAALILIGAALVISILCLAGFVVAVRTGWISFVGVV